MLGKSIRQAMFGLWKWYPIACGSWKGDIERIHPPSISSKNKL